MRPSGPHHRSLFVPRMCQPPHHLLGLRINSIRRAVQASSAKWNVAPSWTGGTPGNPASACRATVSSASATSVTGSSSQSLPWGVVRSSGSKASRSASMRRCSSAVLSNGAVKSASRSSDCLLRGVQTCADKVFRLSGWRDLNSRPLDPQCWAERTPKSVLVRLPWSPPCLYAGERWRRYLNACELLQSLLQ
jgi:hypothetical protein